MDRVAEQNISKSKTYWASINYEYQIQEHKYVGHKISFHCFIIQYNKVFSISNFFYKKKSVYEFAGLIYVNQRKLISTVHVYPRPNELRKKIDNKKRLSCLKCECAYNI